MLILLHRTVEVMEKQLVGSMVMNILALDVSMELVAQLTQDFTMQMLGRLTLEPIIAV